MTYTCNGHRGIVAEIEAERASVRANGDLIARMEKKIEQTVARIWGADGSGSEDG